MKKRLALPLLLLGSLFYTTIAWSQLVQLAKQPDSLTSGRNTFRPLTLGNDTQGAYSMSEVMAPGHFGAPLHQHKTYTESFYVLAGYLTVYLNGKIHRLGPGSFLLVPRGAPHTMDNTDAEPVRFLLTVSPSALFEGLMAEQVEMAKTLKPNHPDFKKRMSELYQKYDMEVLGVSPIKH